MHEPGKQVLFHEVGCLFPGETTVDTLEPSRSVKDALAIMLEKNYSQMPVVETGIVRGVFSYRSLAANVVRMAKLDIASLPVEEVMEQIPYVSVKDSLHSILAQLNQHDALLVGDVRQVQAIATTFDVLGYFYSLAKPYILLWEIELTLRRLIAIAAPPDTLRSCIATALTDRYEQMKRPCPSSLDQMTFDDYRTVLGCKENWPHFERTLGRREVVLTRLEQVRDIRNDVFHFRDALTFEKHQTLASTRAWVWDKVNRAERMISGGHDGN